MISNKASQDKGPDNWSTKVDDSWNNVSPVVRVWLNAPVDGLAIDDIEDESLDFWEHDGSLPKVRVNSNRKKRTDSKTNGKRLDNSQN